MVSHPSLLAACASTASADVSPHAASSSGGAVTSASSPSVVGAPSIVPRKAYNATTEISLSRIFALGQVDGHGTLSSLSSPALLQHAAGSSSSASASASASAPPVVSMSALGELGRFGNQMLQYMFMRIYAENAGAQLQLPDWVGKYLFGLTEEVPSRALPAVIEARDYKANSTFNDSFLEYIVQSNGGAPVDELRAEDLHVRGAGDQPRARFVNRDFWGWFQFHSSVYAPYRAQLQRILHPVPELQAALAHALDTLRFGRDATTGERVRRTVVAVHLRRGDYENIAASSFGYIAPTAWYLEWLDRIWATLDNPVLFVASDELANVIDDFARFQPYTCDSLAAAMPDSMLDLKAGFYPDFYLLANADVLGISNSTFSFSAAMLNTQPGARFYRAHYADKMVPFDPWNADPILHRPIATNIVASTVDTLSMVYRTQGLTALLRNVTYELPYYALRSTAFRIIFWCRRLFA